MNLRKIIVELQAEKSRLDEAIIALERLSTSKRRSRPSRWLNQAAVASAGADSTSQAVGSNSEKASA